MIRKRLAKRYSVTRARYRAVSASPHFHFAEDVSIGPAQVQQSVACRTACARRPRKLATHTTTLTRRKYSKRCMFHRVVEVGLKRACGTKTNTCYALLLLSVEYTVGAVHCWGTGARIFLLAITASS
jgi:hypothetical protein